MCGSGTTQKYIVNLNANHDQFKAARPLSLLNIRAPSYVTSQDGLLRWLVVLLHHRLSRVFPADPCKMLSVLVSPGRQTPTLAVWTHLGHLTKGWLALFGFVAHCCRIPFERKQACKAHKSLLDPNGSSTSPACCRN